MADDGVPQLAVRHDGIDIPSADAPPLHVTLVDQVADDPLGRALGDPNPLSNVAEPDFGIPRDAEQNRRMVRDKRPRRRGFGGWTRHSR